MKVKEIKRIVIAYPSGNTTALVFDPLPTVDRKLLNEEILQAWQEQNPHLPEIEQCCFITEPSPNSDAIARIEMFGGEFCGNATRSAIWLATGGKDAKGRIETSGIDRPLDFTAENGNVTLAMPLPNTSDFIREVEEGALVQLDGISQLVVTEQSIAQTPRQLLKHLLDENKYDLSTQPAVGVTYYNQVTNKAQFCVWVKAINTIFDETACGSGTSAIGIALATKAQSSINVAVLQPSGEIISTSATYGRNRVTSSGISGTVSILYDGKLELL